MIDISAIMKRVEGMRQELHLSQSQFALRLEISRTAYQNLVQGQTQNILKHLGRMAEVLGTSEEFLLLGYEPVAGDTDALHAAEGYKERMNVLISDYEDKLTRLRGELDLKNRLLASQEEMLGVYRQVISRYEKNGEND